MPTYNLQQNVTYSFIIEDRTGGDSGGPLGSSNGKKTARAPTSDATFAENAYKLYKSAPAMFALKGIDNVVTTWINTVELRTGNSTLQQQMQWKYSTAKQLGGAAISIAAGIATGNPALIIGGVMAGVNYAKNIAISQYEINLQRQVENIGIGLANIRAGSGGDRYSRASY